MGYDGSSGITGLYAPHDGLPPDYPVIEQQPIMACLYRGTSMRPRKPLGSGCTGTGRSSAVERPDALRPLGHDNVSSSLGGAPGHLPVPPRLLADGPDIRWTFTVPRALSSSSRGQSCGGV